MLDKDSSPIESRFRNEATLERRSWVEQALLGVRNRLAGAEASEPTTEPATRSGPELRLVKGGRQS